MSGEQQAPNRGIKSSELYQQFARVWSTHEGLGRRFTLYDRYLAVRDCIHAIGHLANRDDLPFDVRANAQSILRDGIYNAIDHRATGREWRNIRHTYNNERDGPHPPHEAEEDRRCAECGAIQPEPFTHCSAKNHVAADLAPVAQTPIDMILFCPRCGTQHVDAEESEKHYRARLSNAMPAELAPRWTNPPHRSHLCHNCYAVWRPADVATNGVAQIKTRGSEDNTWTNAVAVPAVPADDGWVTFGRVKVDIETETETFERIDPAPSLQPASPQSEEIAREIVQTIVKNVAFDCGAQEGECRTMLCEHWQAKQVERIASALTNAQSKGAELQKEVDAKAICFMCAEPEKYQPPRDVEGFDKPCHFYTDSHPLRPNCNAAECKAAAIRAAQQQ